MLLRKRILPKTIKGIGVLKPYPNTIVGVKSNGRNQLIGAIANIQRQIGVHIVIVRSLYFCSVYALKGIFFTLMVINRHSLSIGNLIYIIVLPSYKSYFYTTKSFWICYFKNIIVIQTVDPDFQSFGSTEYLVEKFLLFIIPYVPKNCDLRSSLVQSFYFKPVILVRTGHNRIFVQNIIINIGRVGNVF